MKRSAQIGLLVMGALTTTSAAGYFATNHDRACQEKAVNNPQGTPPQDCRRSVWYGSGHGSGGSHSYFGSSSSSGSSNGTSSHSSPGSSTASRGGFGGHAGHGGSGS
jgi:hypothetical protein